MTKLISVQDYVDSTLHIYAVDDGVDLEEFVEKRFSMSNCEWFEFDNIRVHTKPEDYEDEK